MPTENEISVLNAARAAGVQSRDELANFMAQTGHESMGFTRLEEGFRYTRGIDAIPVQAAFREGREVLEAARQDALEGRPAELARLMYGNRMGNDDADDGYLYRGRGYVMLTGEANYREAGETLELDLVTNPGLAAEPEHAARIAVWYWHQRVQAEDRDDVSAATRAVNGGENGLADRHNRFDAWHAVLTPEFLADVDAGRLQPGAAVVPRVGWAPMADGALRRGETGDEVEQLQEDLRELGMRDGRGRTPAVSRTFGASTEQAVRSFQQQNDLPVTGRADPSTLDSIDEAMPANRVPPQPPARGPALQQPGEASPRALLEQAEAAVRLLEVAMGRQYDDTSERMTASLACLAKEHGFTRIDHVVLSEANSHVRQGENVFVVQGALDNPAHHRAHMKTQTAIEASVEQSMERFQSISCTAQYAAEQEFVQQARRGPVIS